MTAALVLLPTVLSLVGQPIFQPKYAIAMLIPLVALAAAGLDALPWARPATATTGLGLLAFIVFAIYAHTGKEQYRELGRYGDQRAEEGVTLVTEARMLPYVSYYSKAPVVVLTPEQPLSGDYALLLAHPPDSESLDERFAACRPLDDVRFVGARATTFRCRR